MHRVFISYSGVDAWMPSQKGAAQPALPCMQEGQGGETEMQIHQSFICSVSGCFCQGRQLVLAREKPQNPIISGSNPNRPMDGSPAALRTLGHGAPRVCSPLQHL